LYLELRKHLGEVLRKPAAQKEAKIEEGASNARARSHEVIRAYIRNQEKEDQRLDQLNLWR
jgi:hypothetical protein